MTVSENQILPDTYNNTLISGRTTPDGKNETAIANWVGFLIFFWLLWLSDAWLYPYDSQSSIAVVKPFSQILQLFVFSSSTILLYFCGASGIIKFLKEKFYFLPFLILCGISLVWAPSQISSVVAYISLLNIAILASFVIAKIDFVIFINYVFRFMNIIIIASIVTIIILPSYGLMAGIHTGKFRGLFAHKNNFGLFLAQYIIILTFFWSAIRSHKYSKISLLIIAAIMLIFTKSAASIVIISLFYCINVLCIISRKISKNAYVNMLFCISLSAFLCFALYQTYDTLLSLIDRDPTFTGRTNVWQYYIQLASERYLFGHGFHALESDPLLALNALSEFNFAARSPHNIYITVFYNEGMFGLVLYLIFMFKVLFDDLRLALRKEAGLKNRIDRFAFCFTATIAIYGMVEAYQGAYYPGLPMLLILTSHFARTNKIPGNFKR
jgi:exopolysaccharide production protein ExoQ